jgi:hypothetical protein
MKRLYLSVAIEMPSSPFDASDVYAKLRTPWFELLTRLEAGGVQHVAKADEMEVRAKVTRKPRKPKLVTPQEAA